MNRKPRLAALVQVLMDVIEVYVPMISFALLFLAFLLQIFFRYFLVPLTWPEEFVLLAFLWTALLGALYAKRTDSHVVFTVIYDGMSPRKQLFVRLLGNALVLLAFLMAIVPSYEYVNFMSFKKSNVMKIPMNVAFFPFVIFLVLMSVRLVYDLYRDIRLLLSGQSVAEVRQ